MALQDVPTWFLPHSLSTPSGDHFKCVNDVLGVSRFRFYPGKSATQEY